MCHQGKRTSLGLQLLYSHGPFPALAGARGERCVRRKGAGEVAYKEPQGT